MERVRVFGCSRSPSRARRREAALWPRRRTRPVVRGLPHVSRSAEGGRAETIAGLAALGVAVKLITGDSQLVAQHVAGWSGCDARSPADGRDNGRAQRRGAVARRGAHRPLRRRSIRIRRSASSCAQEDRARRRLPGRRRQRRARDARGRHEPVGRAGRRRGQRGRRLRPARTGSRCHPRRHRGGPRRHSPTR